MRPALPPDDRSHYCYGNAQQQDVHEIPIIGWASVTDSMPSVVDAIASQALRDKADDCRSNENDTLFSHKRRTQPKGPRSATRPARDALVTRTRWPGSVDYLIAHLFVIAE